MKLIHFLTAVFLFITSLSGCSSFNCTPLEGLIGGDVNLISLGNKIADDLVDSSMPPLMPYHPDEAILTASFVDIDNFETSSTFGRILQSNCGTRLVQKGYTVKEINLRTTLKIRPQDGEKSLSRDLGQINPEVSAQAILLGSYSLNNRILYINAKLVNPANRNIIAAQSYRLCMDDNLLAMFGLKRKYEDPNTVDAPSESILNKIFY